MTEKEYNEKIAEQWRYIEELKLLVAEWSAIKGRPLISCSVTFGCEIETEYGTA